MNFTKKFLFIFFIICLLFFSFIGFSTNKVFASSLNTYHFTLLDKSYDFTYELEDELPYFYIFTEKHYYSGDYFTIPYFIASSVPLVISTTKIGDEIKFVCTNYDTSFDILTISGGDPLTWSSIDSSSIHRDKNAGSNACTYTLSSEPSFVYSNYTLKSVDGNVVFQSAPHKEGILTPIATSMDFSQVMTEVLQILPMMLLILISLIGLMKAIKLLFKVLRQS